ncbi:MAG: ankyrin repeat domain-containing protein [Rickettsia endosymbiont of Culicoides impunctatus]|uniref:ankyrin repeat domain-containing protein n=1 Tax=unclassified Candidatus Tisiphia TaxID=2996318 RepID=UPI001E728C7D|nr:MAG: ankyrin repeat domain-containing protein [Rickettsia endosymbiont of Culicoides impunctatus]
MSLKQLFYKARYGGLPVLLNKNALFKAVETGNMHLTNHLLTKANVDNQDKSGNTALHYAVKNNRHDMAEMLLKWGAKPNIANDNGMTASDIGIANVIFARLCMQPLLENHDFKMTSTDSLVDAVRWHIDSLRTLHTLNNQQQVHLSPKISSNLKELSNNVNSLSKAISNNIANPLYDDVPNNDIVLSGDGMTTELSDIF